MTSPATVSVVISTLNRADLLGRLLSSLQWLSSAVPFEVIVVVGPCTDETGTIVEQWLDRIKLVEVDRANLSFSRNRGIARAAGDVIAFIDDDGVPESEWLIELLAQYDSDQVGASGGWVYDHTGVNFQYQYGLVDRLGYLRTAPSTGTTQYSFPGSHLIPHLLGTNASFLADALVAVGGFDEEFEYFLDETDALVRVMDAGFDIRQVPGAFVHHKFAPSAIRLGDRFARNRFSIIKNHVYFARRHATPHLGEGSVTEDIECFVESHRREMRAAQAQNVINPDELAKFESDADRGRRTGEMRAAEPRVLLTELDERGPFRRFPVIARGERIIVAPSEAARGDAVVSAARDFAADGWTTHAVVPSGATHHYVDFEDGVWTHHVPSGRERLTAAAAREIADIQERRRVDAVRWM